MQQEDTEKERDTPCVVGTENSAGNLFGVLYGENNQLNERPGYIYIFLNMNRFSFSFFLIFLPDMAQKKTKQSGTS